MLLLWFGGTFDPVHNGHLAIARAARDELGVAVRLMPAADPPHRPAPGADAVVRARMLELAIGEEPGLVLDRRELARPGPSYTVDTLRALRDEFGPDRPLALLLGADSFLSLPTWRDWRALFGLAHFVVAERAGSAPDAEAALAAAAEGRWTMDPARLAAAPAGLILRLRHPLAPESATGVRGLIAAGRPWQDRVPPRVAEFIRIHGLYTGQGYNSPTSS